MNEKTKNLMNEQITGIVNNLQNTFGLPVFEDEIAEDEEASLEVYNCFVFETSEFKPTNDIRKLSQNINVYYYSENQDNVDEQTIDIITVINAVKGVSFLGSSKERLQVKDTDRFIDRVVLTFKRVIPIECTI
ncbi:hypothetical protein [Peribacillus tepidiphilus]|uniref:hypothetical protein n=1 Tax=Peribacillus tepidiphilus TaxID=2652445 RepID=UPI001CDD8C6C|nr:hypothetical protein [Peribacillus tepidiphilus]